MFVLLLELTEYTQEIAAGVVDVFQCCVSKRIQWTELNVHLPVVNNQNRFLHLILSEARRLQQFKKVTLCGGDDYDDALTNETAMELCAMVSSEQGIKGLMLFNVRLLPDVLTTLSEGFRAKRVAALQLLQLSCVQFMVDGEIEGRDGEMAYFIESLRRNKSLQYFALDCSHLSGETLSRVILALVGHPMLQELNLNGNEQGLHKTTRALCFLFVSPGIYMLSKLSFGFRSSHSQKINVGPLAEAIVGYGCLEHLDLSGSRLDNDDLVTLLDAASRCRTLVTLDVNFNKIGNLHLVDGIMQTHYNPNNPTSRLRTLNLERNPLGEGDRAALAKLVEDHPELQAIGLSKQQSLLITPAIQYMLDLNRGGRVLLKDPSIPLSGWPTVLE
jgi:hypothetical protein